jgi:hypothetical protein
MKKFISMVAILTLISFAFLACEEDEPTQPQTSQTATALYVLNAIGVSISQVDLETNEVTNDIVTLGTWPNQLVYRKGKVYAVNSGSNNIMIFNADTWAPEAPLALGAGNNPMNMVFYNDNIAYVSCSVSNKVLQVDFSSKTVTKTIDAGVGATGIVYANNKIYTANTAFNGANYTYGQGTVTVINGQTGAKIKDINVFTNPQDLAVAPDGKVHVVCTGDYFSQFGKVAIIDPASDMMVDSVIVGGTPGIIRISTPDKLGYLASWGMGCLVYKTDTKEITHGEDDYFLGMGGSGLYVDPLGNVFVSVWEDDQVIKVDKDGTVLNTYNVGDSPSNLASKLE